MPETEKMSLWLSRPITITLHSKCLEVLLSPAASKYATQTLATAHENGEILLWKVFETEGDLVEVSLRTLCEAFPTPPFRLGFSNKGNWLIMITTGLTKVFDLHEFNAQRDARAVILTYDISARASCFAFSPDESQMALGCLEKLELFALSAQSGVTHPPKVDVFNGVARRGSHRFAEVSSCAFSQDARILGACARDGVFFLDKGEFTHFPHANLARTGELSFFGEEVCVPVDGGILKIERRFIERSGEGGGEVAARFLKARSYAVCPRRKFFASARGKRLTLVVDNIRTGVSTRKALCKPKFSSNGSHLVDYDGSLMTIWDLTNSHRGDKTHNYETFEFALPGVDLPRTDHWQNSWSLGPDGKWLAYLLDENTLRLQDISHIYSSER